MVNGSCILTLPTVSYKPTMSKEDNMGTTSQCEGITAEFGCQFTIHLTARRKTPVAAETQPRARAMDKYGNPGLTVCFALSWGLWWSKNAHKQVQQPENKLPQGVGDCREIDGRLLRLHANAAVGLSAVPGCRW